MLRRPGRARSDWWAGVGLALTAVLFTVWHHSAKDQGHVSLPERCALGVLGPLQSVMTRGWSGCEGAARSVHASFVDRRCLVADRERLQAEVSRLQGKLLQLHNDMMTIRRFKQEIGVETPPVDRVTARVIGRSSGGATATLDIEAIMGRELHEGEAVRTWMGLVGRIEQAKGSRAKVRLITDPSHGLTGKDSRSGCYGTIMGRDLFEEHSDYLTFCRLGPNDDVQVGDKLYTAARGHTYPPGLPVGSVEEVSRERPGQLHKMALVRPFADLGRLEWVYVVPGK